MKNSLKMPRLEVVDALRGFAVMTILLIHSVEHFIFPDYPDPVLQPSWLNVLDTATFSVIFSLIAGKAYAIFALLFGFTFYMQYSNREAKGEDFGMRFLWRLLILVGFATLNAAFFPGGDVLLLFCLVGVVLFLVRKWSDNAIWITMIILLLQPIEWFHYFASLLNPHYTLPDLGVGVMYNALLENTKNAGFWDFIVVNVTTGQKASLLWAVGGGRFLQTAGLFLMGLYLSRKKLFIQNEANNRTWTKILIASAIVYCPLIGLHNELLKIESALLAQTVTNVVDMWHKLAFTLVLLSSFILLYNTERFRKWTTNLRYYGKMSLTNYITQSLVGALIYFPFGLYLAPYCGYAASLAIGFVMFLVQLYACRLWLQKHKMGPFEKLWHQLTWIGSK